MIHQWIIAFALTQLIEAPLYYWALKKDSNVFLSVSQHSTLKYQIKLIVFSLFPSVLTHPSVWFVFTKLRTEYHWSYSTYFLGAETFAVLVEALFLWCIGCRRALLISLCINGISMSIGGYIFLIVLKLV